MSAGREVGGALAVLVLAAEANKLVLPLLDCEESTASLFVDGVVIAVSTPVEAVTAGELCV